jgi:hypothetical protein
MKLSGREQNNTHQNTEERSKTGNDEVSGRGLFKMVSEVDGI